MKVQAMLAQKGDRVVTVRSDMTIGEVVNVLHKERIGAVVVSDDGTSVRGILSERDVVRGLVTGGTDLLGTPVSGLMTKKVMTCVPDDDIESIMAEMTRSRIRHLPVVVEGKLRGMISIGDVVKNRLGELEAEASALRDYVSGRA